MSAHTDTDYVALVEAMPPAAVLTLHDIDWDEYESLLQKLDERPGIRLTYDHGRLEIMTLSSEHERTAALFAVLILILAEECGLDYLSLKSTTLRKRKRSQGLEPDDCFYFGDFKKISGKKTLDLSVDPPPSLAIEVDISSGSMRKFPIYESIGVPELWHHDGREIRFYSLLNGQYTEINHSNLFPFVTPDVVVKFVRKGAADGTVAMAKAFRTWVRAHKGQADRRRKPAK